MLKGIFILLLIFHVTFGFTALTAAFGALLCKKGFHYHRICGRFFITAMTGIVITAVPMSIIVHSFFLYLIAIFSYYLAFSGWRFATNRSGIASKLDWLASFIMLATGLIMISFGLNHFDAGNYQKIVIMIFGFIGTISAIGDLKTFIQKKATGLYRISKHLTAMLGATIAASTAFVVTNIHVEPRLLVWLGPTIVITPLIIWWKNHIKYVPYLNQKT